MSDLDPWMCIWKLLPTATVHEASFDSLVGKDSPQEVARQKISLSRDRTVNLKIRPWGICFQKHELGVIRKAFSRSATGEPNNSGSFAHPAHSHKNPKCICNKPGVVQTSEPRAMEVNVQIFRKLKAIKGKECFEDDRRYVQRILDATDRSWRSQK